LSLKSRLEIDRLFKSGRRLSGDYFTLVWEKNEKFSYGVFVPKNYGPAVKRNRAKRLFREAIRVNRHILGDNVRMAVLLKVSTQDLDLNSLNGEIEQLFRVIESRAK